MKYTELGNTAVKYEPEYQPQYEPEQPPQKQEKQRRRLSTKEVPFGLKVKIVTRVLFVTALALLMIARFATVSVANIKLVEAKKDVKAQIAANTDLESTLSASMQLDTIQEKATKMGMTFPGNDQMVYVKLVSYDDLMKQNSANLEKDSKNVVTQLID